MLTILATTTTIGWETYGPLGVIAAMGLAFFSKAYKREADRADRLESYVQEILPRVLSAVELLGAEARRRK